MVIEDESRHSKQASHEDEMSSLASPDLTNKSDKAPNSSERKKIKQAANAESPVLKSQEIFGAVKVKDGLFLGD